MAYLLLIDTTQTQRYIFSSNRMRENIGASYLIAKATTEWVFQAIVGLNIAHKYLSKRNRVLGTNAIKHFLQFLFQLLIVLIGR